MTPNQTQILLLLLGLTVTSGAPLCVLDETRCVCNVMVFYNPQRLNCSNALELELRDGRLDIDVRNVLQSESPFDKHFTSFLYRIDKLIFNNATISSSFINVVILFLSGSKSNLNKISIISSSLENNQPIGFEIPPSRITNLLLDDVTVDPSLLQPSFRGLHRWMFASLESLVLVRSGLVEIDCYLAQRAENLVWLDLSENPVSFTSLQNISYCSGVSFKYLKSLRLRRVNLTSLQPLCTLLSTTPALTDLDVSGNNLSTVHYYPLCPQVKPLRRLNLSNSGITEFNSLLLTSLEELDLSYNSLEVFNSPPQTLKKLNLSNNHLIRLPPLGNPSQLQELRVDSNRLTVLINEAGVGLSTLEKLKILHAGGNPYQCDCDLKETVLFLNNSVLVSVEDYPQEYLCASPVDQQGTRITDLSFETCGTQRHGSPLCLTLCMGLLSHLIYYY